MPVPPLKEIRAPALQLFADGKTRKLSEVYAELAEHFHLSQDDLNELLPSGGQTKWENRANWACYDLFRAGLFNRPKKGVYSINDLGAKVAAAKPAVVSREFLMQFPQFADWIAQSSGSQPDAAGKPDGVIATAAEAQTPDEVIDGASKTLHAQLKAELLDRVMKMDPFRFEHLVVDLLLAMGYGGSREEAAEVTKKSNDEGVDGLINEDRLGLDRIYVQAKRWQHSVGRPEIQSFVGALAGQQAHKGVFITTSDFSQKAIDFVKSLSARVILINGVRLAELMIEHNIGVAVSRTVLIKRMDSDYFDDV